MDILTINDAAGQYPDTSYYTATADVSTQYPSARGDLSCDVCVVGGGFTGLSASLHLAQKGYDVVLLDAHRVGWGASGRNGGQVGTGQRRDQDELERMFGKSRARSLWDISLRSTELVRDLIDRHTIACGYTPGILHTDHRQRFVAHSREYARKLQEDYGYDKIRAVGREEVRNMVGSPAYFGGTLDMGGAHLHPLNFALGLARAAKQAGVRIFECSRVTEIAETSPTTVKTDRASIRAEFVAMGCNGYLGRLKDRVAARVMPINNYIIATKPLGPAAAKDLIRDNVAVADSKFVINYFRLSQDNRMLFGGGESYSYRFPRDIAALVRRRMSQIYPQLSGVQIDYAWGGTLGITLNRMPHFQRLQGNILSASGFSGHGVALATLAGALMADAIAGQAETFDIMAEVPTPAFPGGVLLRWPLLVLAMTWFSLRDRL
jgi:gamma-glutamylputrescine oxidase